jgi:hypothetical protein
VSSTVVWIELSSPPAPIATRDGGHRHVVGRLPKVVAVVVPERVPEAVKFAADRLDVLLRGSPPILRLLDEPRPCFGRVAEPRQIERRDLSLLQRR